MVDKSGGINPALLEFYAGNAPEQNLLRMPEAANKSVWHIDTYLPGAMVGHGGSVCESAGATDPSSSSDLTADRAQGSLQKQTSQHPNKRRAGKLPKRLDTDLRQKEIRTLRDDLIASYLEIDRIFVCHNVDLHVDLRTHPLP